MLSELGERLANAALVQATRRMGERAAHAANVKQLSVPATARVMKQLGYETEARTGILCVK